MPISRGQPSEINRTRASLPGKQTTTSLRQRCVAFLVACLCVGQADGAEVPDPDPGRFAESIAEFAAWDSKNAFPERGILFVGSSSVRTWPTAQAFVGKPVIKRGFGGFELSDVIHFYEQVIRPYSPRKIFLYAGDNDIGNGKSPEQVFGDYKALVVLVAEDLPDAELVFIFLQSCCPGL